MRVGPVTDPLGFKASHLQGEASAVRCTIVKRETPAFQNGGQGSRRPFLRSAPGVACAHSLPCAETDCDSENHDNDGNTLAHERSQIAA